MDGTYYGDYEINYYGLMKLTGTGAISQTNIISELPKHTAFPSDIETTNLTKVFHFDHTYVPY